MRSQRLIVTPKSDTEWHAMRHQDITSTESSALFNMSPYSTHFELWHRKQEPTPPVFSSSERMKWGTRLQDTIARGIAEDYGVKVRRLNAYVKLTDARMGASFDFEIVGVNSDRLLDHYDETLINLYEEHGPGILEIKNVDGLIFKQQWQADGDGDMEAPPQIEIQVQHQLHCIGRAWSALGVLVGGNTPIVIIRHRDEEVGAAIESRVREFWRSVEANQPPPPVFPDDAAFACKLYGFAEPGKLYDGRQDGELAELCATYAAAASIERQAKEDKKIAQAKIFTHIGDAEKALVAGFKISAAMVSPTHVEFDREGFRGFRVTPTKERKAA